MNVALWIVQVLLAAAFLMVGTMKSFTPIHEIATQMAWAAAVPEWVVRTAGFSEILGGLGLILPSITRILPRLTPLAASGLGTVMILASVLHLSRGEFGSLLPNTILLGLAVFVAWGRTRKVPIEARGTRTPRSALAS